VALIVIGPEKLPRVARTVGHMLGKAQRYVADVKAEVNRSIELDELKKMKTQFEDAARDVEKSVQAEVQQASASLESGWSALSSDSADADSNDGLRLPPQYKHPKKRWRCLYHCGVARVARFRPPGVGPK
jgi:sec-independent protein translocase protein TatB